MTANLSEFIEQCSDVELANIAQWPYMVKTVLLIFLVLIILISGYALVISKQIKHFDKVILAEEELKQEYKIKHTVSAKLTLLEQQIAMAEAMFKAQLKSLPENHDIPGLLDDITFAGTTTGLDVVKIHWQTAIEQEIYVELPIDIEVLGTYHEFGQFVSRIAYLPTMVTLHDFTIEQKKTKSKELKLTLQAKTYRYRKTGMQ